MFASSALHRIRGSNDSKVEVMANLNLQAAPRSLGGSRSGFSGGGGGAGGGGHVTPTSGLFTPAFAPPGGGGGLSPSRLSAAAAAAAAGGGGGSQPGGGGRTAGGGGSLFSRSAALAAAAAADRRQVTSGLTSVMQDWNSSSMGSMANFGMVSSRSYSSGGGGGGGTAGGGTAGGGSLTTFHSVFSSDSSTPPLLDLSEFPSLTARGGGGGGGGGSGSSDSALPVVSSALQPGKQPYVGMVKQPTSESSEFTMSSEDFPALPGSESTGGSGGGGSGGGGAPGVGGGLGGGTAGGEKTAGEEGFSRLAPAGGPPPPPAPGGVSASSLSGGQLLPSSVTAETAQSSNPSSKSSLPPKRGIQTSPDGKVTNIPNSMVKDQFGMVGLLTFIRAAETDPNLVSLALGQDLTALGLNLNSPDNLYPTFGGPWAETPLRAQDIDYNVPPEYIINHSIRDKLAQLKLTRYKEDLLFFMYYTNAGDMLQLAAAAELYSREWRYHMEEKVWITQAPGCGVIEKTSTYERGTYYFFDAQNWRKVAKEFYLDYSKLENQPNIPPYHGGV